MDLGQGLNFSFFYGEWGQPPFVLCLHSETTFVTSCLLCSTLDKELPKKALFLTLLHSEWPKLFGVLAILSAIGLIE